MNPDSAAPFVLPPPALSRRWLLRGADPARNLGPQLVTYTTGSSVRRVIPQPPTQTRAKKKNGKKIFPIPLHSSFLTSNLLTIMPIRLALLTVFVTTAICTAQTTAPKPSYREWYYAGSLISGKETTPTNGVHGVTSANTEHLCLAKDGTATITYYFEDDAPFQRTRKLPAHGTTLYRHYNFKEEKFPIRKLFGAKVTTDQPTVVQITRGGWHLMALPIGDVELKN